MRRNRVSSVNLAEKSGQFDVPEGGRRPIAPTVTVVIPTLNEAGNLPYVLN